MITGDEGGMRRNETQGDARRRKYPSVEASSKWLGPARGRAITERASERRTSPGRALEKEASQHLRSLGEKKSVPVVPVFQLISRHPHFSLIIYNYLITN